MCRKGKVNKGNRISNDIICYRQKFQEEISISSEAIYILGRLFKS